MQHIIPAIIPDSYDQLQSRLREVKGIVNRIQIDVMNGTYAPTSSWPYAGADREAFEAIRREDQGLPYWQDFDFEIDLLLKNPEERISEWALAGASCLIFHVESTDKLEEIAHECYERRIEMALALKPSTDIELLAPFIDRALFVQVMGNDRIGYHGVSLDAKALDTIRAIKARWPNVVVGVDIGVSAETLPKLCQAGATRFVAGSAIFNFNTPAGAISHLESVLKHHLVPEKTDNN
jgi:ribulose-phosphate 3-epimerase